MTEPFIEEIKMTAIDFTQKGWAFCNGQAIVINQNQMLYSLQGNSVAHFNIQPFLSLNLCICIDGIFPSRS